MLMSFLRDLPLSTEHSASQVVLQLGELTLLDCVTSQQVVTEVKRNLAAKLPSKLPELQLILSRSLRTVSDPRPQDVHAYSGQADPKDLPILVAALQARCSHLLTFNLRHFTPTDTELTVQRPGEFVKTVRTLLSQLSQT